MPWAKLCFAFWLLFYLVNTGLFAASYDYKTNSSPLIDLHTISDDLYLWNSYYFSGDFNEVVRDWHLQHLIQQGVTSIGSIESRQDIWLNLNPKDDKVNDRLKDAISVNLILILFRSKEDALEGANFVRQAPFVGQLLPGSFSGKPIGNVVWSSKNVDATPDDSRPLEILFAKNKVVIHIFVTKLPLTKWSKVPVSAVWIERLAIKIAERIQ